MGRNNGCAELAQSNLIESATRINPEATESQRALLFVKDIAREQYQVRLFSLPVDSGKLTSLRCKLNTQQLALVIFAITVEHAE